MRSVQKIGIPFGTLARQVEKLARLLARWHTRLKHWHIVWHVDTFIGRLAHKNEKSPRFRHVATQAHMTRDLANLGEAVIETLLYLIFQR